MNWLELLGIAVGLAMDAFAVAAAVGVRLESVTPRHAFRLAFHFGLFQFMMPVIGWLAGTRLSGAIGGVRPTGGVRAVERRGRQDAVGRPTRPAAGDRRRSDPRTDAGDPFGGDERGCPGRGRQHGPDAGFRLDAQRGHWPGGRRGDDVGIHFGGRLGLRWGRVAEMSGGVVLLLISLQPLILYLTATMPDGVRHECRTSSASTASRRRCRC